MVETAKEKEKSAALGGAAFGQDDEMPVSPAEFFWRRMLEKGECEQEENEEYLTYTLGAEMSDAEQTDTKNNCKKKRIVEIDGVQVFSADFVFGQMQAQSSRIICARDMAKASLILGILSVVLGIIAMFR